MGEGDNLAAGIGTADSWWHIPVVVEGIVVEIAGIEEVLVDTAVVFVGMAAEEAMAELEAPVAPADKAEVLADIPEVMAELVAQVAFVDIRGVMAELVVQAVVQGFQVGELPELPDYMPDMNHRH